MENVIFEMQRIKIYGFWKYPCPVTVH